MLRASQRGAIPFIVAFLFSITAFGQGQTLTLDQAVNYALTNTTAMRNAQLAIADADQFIKEQLASGLPNINGNVNYNRYIEVPQIPNPFGFLSGLLPDPSEAPDQISLFQRNNLIASANLETMIFDASFFVGLKAARESRKYYELLLQAERRNVRDQVTDAYLPVLLLDANRRQLRKNISNLEKLLQETQQIYESGFVEQLDVDRLRLSLANLETELENLDRQRENALRALKFTMNYPIEDTIDIVGQLDSMDLTVDSELLMGTFGYEGRPELAALDQAISLNNLNIQLNRTAYLPTINGTASYQYQYQGDNFSDGFWAPTAVVGLNIQIPIFEGFGRRARTERARIDLQEVQNQRVDAVRVIELEVRNARTNYTSALDRLENREQNLALANRIYETTQIKYREGVGSSLEVTQSEQELYEAQSNYLQAVYEVLQAKSDLQYAMGRW